MMVRRTSHKPMPIKQLELTAYLPEERFGLAMPGQQFLVRVDAYPEREFIGRVMRLADEAEFTPTNVQTKEDRTRSGTHALPMWLQPLPYICAVDVTHWTLDELKRAFSEVEVHHYWLGMIFLAIAVKDGSQR